MANTEAVIRSVVVVGFQGVQALDLVGPFDVFTGATVCLASQGRGDDGYEVSMASVDARPVSTGAGLELVAKPLPDPREPIDTVVLPGGFGTGTARQDARLIEWIKAVAPNARRVISVRTEAARRQARGDRRHRHRDRIAVRVRHCRNHAAQLRSTDGHLA